MFLFGSNFLVLNWKSFKVALAATSALLPCNHRLSCGNEFNGPQLAHWGVDEGRVTRRNAIDHRCHRMEKVTNFKYLNMPPKETIHSQCKAVTVHPGSNTGGEV